MLQVLGAFCVKLSHKYIPNPLIFAIILSAIIFVLGIGVTGAGPFEMIQYWYSGFWNLLSFGMQMVALLLFGYVLASSPPVRAVVAWAARFPRSSGQAIMLIASLAMLFAYVNWGLGLIVGAIAAREVSKQAKRRGIRVHYPLAAAAGFCGLMIFAGGFSASAPLLMNSPGNFMYDDYGLIPVSDTILSSYNLVIVAVWMIVIPFVYRAMQPSADDIIEIDDEPEVTGAPAATQPSGEPRHDETGFYRSANPHADSAVEFAPDGTMALSQSTVGAVERYTVAEHLERSTTLTWMIVASGLCYIAYHFVARGFDLNLNIVNFILLIAGMAAYRTPIRYVEAVDEGIGACGQIVLQFPFYAGIMGMMTGSGMISMFAGWLVTVSSAYTFPLLAMLSAALVNLFVPSAGGQWVIQGPLLLESAAKLGVDNSVVVMAFTYGDQITNGIQPFWMLPLLGVTFLKAREILGYTAVVMLISFVIFGVGITVLPPIMG
ncbi:short-chain fatty acid transporter [Salinisphaera aquimarina]|uniref:Short-chain fatty acid transporter n=1 Tax=Salinisphaera aquimarina TaxID=2094031 RepID=A0ABV7ES70_9GAMM